MYLHCRALETLYIEFCLSLHYQESLSEEPFDITKPSEEIHAYNSAP